MISFRDIKRGLSNFAKYKRKQLITGIVISISYFNYAQVEIPIIRTLSCHTGQVEIAWDGISDPLLSGYVIQYGKLSGNPFPSWIDVPLPTIPPGQTSVMFDPGIIIDENVFKEPVTFAVKALLSNGDESKSDRIPWDSTIFLTAKFDSCLAKIELNWTGFDYNRWNYGAKAVYLYVKENDGPYKIVDTLPPEQRSYAYTSLLANNTYKLYVAYEADNGTGEQSTSIEQSINTGMAEIPAYMYANYATYKDGNVEVDFSIDPNSELKRYNLLRTSSIGGSFEIVKEFNDVVERINYVDPVDYNQGPYYYKLEVINGCEENIRESDNIASSILLTVEGEPLEPILQWNAYSNWINGVSEYQIERRIGNREPELIISGENGSFTDFSLSQQVEQGNPARVCYRISGFEENNPFGKNATSYSNERCVELPVNIRFEYDAFTPGQAFNNRFGPTMDFVPDEFDFSILDRNGFKLFNTNNPQNPYWDGTYNGKIVSSGAYLYVVRYKMGKGKNKFIRGGLVVLTP